MNRLTDRLQLMADQINKGETMADIGTDHGFLPLYLWKEGICPSVIMCDISEPSLAKAKEAAQIFMPCKDLQFRAGDGLRVLDFEEVDSVVIAGMGGLLMCDILSYDLKKTHSFRKYILQPRNNGGQLRRWLTLNGFMITDNLLVREGKFICEIIVAITNEEIDNTMEIAGPESASWDFPTEMVETQGSLAYEYAETRLGIEIKIRDGIMKGCNVCEGDVAAVDKRIEYYRTILEGQ